MKRLLIVLAILFGGLASISRAAPVSANSSAPAATLLVNPTSGMPYAPAGVIPVATSVLPVPNISAPISVELIDPASGNPYAVSPGVTKDVRVYGAVCDGVTDDTTAIQAAITAASPDGTVLIPGKCATATGITLPSSTAVNLQGVTTSTSALVATATMTNLLYKADGFVTNPGTIRDLTLNANQKAAHALNIESYRKLYLYNLSALDATDNVYVFGKVGATYLTGVNAYNINVDESNVATSLGVGARPAFGIQCLQTCNDSVFDTALISHVATAGVYVRGDNNRFYNIHPWGYGPNGAIPNSWPQFAIQIAGFSNQIFGTEADTVQLAAFDAVSGYFNAVGTQLILNDSAETSCPTYCYLVQAESGAVRINVTGSQFIGLGAGTPAVPSGSPVNWVGSIDTNSAYYNNAIGWTQNLSTGSAQAFGYPAAGTTGDSFYLTNPQAATNSTQYWSPALNFGGQGWNTTSSASNAVNWRVYVKSFSGSTPSSGIYFDRSVNGGSYSNAFNVGSGGNINSTYAQTGWTNSTGTTFTVAASSCGTNAPTSVTGGASSGTFVAANSGTCTFTMTINGASGTSGAGPAHGWICLGWDVTAGTTLVPPSVGSTTTCAIKGTVSATTDTVAFAAFPGY